MSLKNLRNVISIFKDIENDNYKVILNGSFDFKYPYFSLSEMKKIIGANIDYSLSNAFFIRDISKLIYDNKIPVLDNSVYKKYKNEINKLELLVNEELIEKGDANEKK